MRGRGGFRGKRSRRNARCGQSRRAGLSQHGPDTELLRRVRNAHVWPLPQCQLVVTYICKLVILVIYSTAFIEYHQHWIYQDHATNQSSRRYCTRLTMSFDRLGVMITPPQVTIVAKRGVVSSLEPFLHINFPLVVSGESVRSEWMYVDPFEMLLDSTQHNRILGSN